GLILLYNESKDKRLSLLFYYSIYKMESGCAYFALKEGLELIQLVVSILLFFVIFFGLSFILNMLLRRTWLMSFVYPIIILLIVDDLSKVEYIKRPIYAITTAFSNLMNITLVDVIILASGFVGTIVSGIVIKFLRKSGYQMF